MICKSCEGRAIRVLYQISFSVRLTLPVLNKSSCQVDDNAKVTV